MACCNIYLFVDMFKFCVSSTKEQRSWYHLCTYTAFNMNKTKNYNIACQTSEKQEIVNTSVPKTSDYSWHWRLLPQMSPYRTLYYQHVHVSICLCGAFSIGGNLFAVAMETVMYSYENESVLSDQSECENSTVVFSYVFDGVLIS